jgi:hypothetical protein
VNKELLEELKEELAEEQAFKGRQSAEEKIKSAGEIANDIIGNEEKINHHGKRAESIVKGMLLHSRGSSGHKEPTDINALADEYLRLSPIMVCGQKTNLLMPNSKPNLTPTFPKSTLIRRISGGCC